MKVFITYSRSDQHEVSSLVKDIEELGHDIWYDQDLSGGQSWWNNILSKIRDCDVYIFALTQEALDSTACKRELKYAEALNRNSLPVLMKPNVSMAMVPRYLSNMHYINYCNPGDKSAVFALIKAIGNLPPSRPLPDPLPTPPDVPISYLDTLKDKIEARSLDRKDQVELMADLKSKLNDPDTKKDDVIKLLRKLRRHDDLLASIGSEIDGLLRDAEMPGREQPRPSVRTNYNEERTVSQAAISPLVQQNIPPAGVAAGGVGTAKSDNSWSSGTMTLLIIGSIIIPLFGIIFGIVGLASHKDKRNQGVILLVISVIMVLIYAAINSGGGYSY